VSVFIEVQIFHHVQKFIYIAYLDLLATPMMTADAELTLSDAKSVA
jgi:hypothetical protein